ncbi:aminoglycoside phosphotransferase family protein, partial [Candidatus Uhrbacteria bacterium]|nr:aminoglycoside phosphotransferase family protein [Candidatus Uhrbacteria bacterium]
SAQSDILKNFPELKIKSFKFAGEGMDSSAFLLNNDLIFRFPKYKKVSAQLKIETAILPRLNRRVSLSIPDFKYVGRQKNGLLFVGYKKIHGVALEKKLFDSFSPQLQAKLLKQIAEFLEQVHVFPVRRAQKKGVKITDFKKRYATVLREVRKVYSKLDRVTIDYVENLFKPYLSDTHNFDYKPELLHSDLSLDHIIYDHVKKSIVGIIDFGDIEIGDPDYDLSYLYLGYGPDFVKRLLRFYHHKNSVALLKKLDFFSRCNVIHDLLMSIERKVKKDIKWAIKLLKREGREFKDFERLINESRKLAKAKGLKRRDIGAIIKRVRQN